MKKLMFRAAIAALFSIALAPARADYVGKDANGGNITFGAFTLGGAQFTKSVPVDAVSGNALFTSSLPAFVQISGTPTVTVTGVSTSALQTTGNTALSSILSALQAATPAGTNTIGSLANISGTIALPTGASTAANQSAANTTLSTIATNTTGAATATGQVTGNTSLSTLVGATGGLGDAAWDGAAANASQTAILKALWSKLSGVLTVDTVVRSVPTDVGGTITAGGAAQTFSTASATARGVMLQNQSNADLWMSCNSTAATQDFRSLKVPAGALYSSDPHHASTGSCSIIGATTGQAFYARRF